MWSAIYAYSPTQIFTPLWSKTLYLLIKLLLILVQLVLEIISVNCNSATDLECQKNVSATE